MGVIIDRDRLDDIIADEPDLLADLIHALREEAPQGLFAIRDALESRDAPSLASAAHRLCGSFGCFYALECANAARALDEMGRGGDLTRAPEALALLERKLEELWTALTLRRSELPQ